MFTTTEILKELDDFVKTNPKNTISIDKGIPFVIVGSGITPDFVYPCMSFESINPNEQKDAIIYTNRVGYKRVIDAYNSNPEETYYVCKFLHSNNHQAILNLINEFGVKNMSYPTSSNIAFLSDDISNNLNTAALRISFIPNLIKNIDIICFSLTMAIIALAIIVSIVVVNKFININKQSLGILLANGISKKKIIASLQPFAFIPCLIGCAIGYFIGLFLQNPAISLLHGYWTLPTAFITFSPLVFIFSLLIPFFFISLACIIIGCIRLKTNVVTLMKNGSEYKVNLIAKIAKKPFSRFNIIFRFRTNLALSSLGKLTILTILTGLSISVFTFAINTYGKIKTNIDTSLVSKNYSFAVDLYTPTRQGGQYTPVPSTYWGNCGIINTESEGKNYFPGIFKTHDDDIFDNSLVNISKDYIYQASLTSFNVASLKEDGVSQGGAHFNTVIPCLSDNFAQMADLQYLKNKSLEKTGTDFNIGTLGITSNPWNIVISLAPDNQINKMNQNAENLFNYAGYKAYPEMVSNVYGFESNSSLVLTQSKIGGYTIPTGKTSPYPAADSNE
jgi:putative ABC transport system permease protein